MRVLFTGASSFSGLWFAKALAEAGHEVVAASRSAGYDDPLRAERMRQVAEVAALSPMHRSAAKRSWI
jgi:UDP-glucose 4-epimerase